MLYKKSVSTTAILRNEILVKHLSALIKLCRQILASCSISDREKW